MREPPAPHPAAVSTFLSRLSDFQIACLLALLCAVSRWLAIPASLWEWDDLLFAHALHKFDVVAHSPHPPGFPVFVALTRLAYWVTRDEYIALTGVAFLFAIFLAPALFYFYRNLFRDRQIAVAGALLTSFLPVIWAHSCAGRSDGPGLVLGVAASALLLGGLESRRALWWGCVVSGLGMGVRVTVMTLAGPLLALVLLWYLRKREWRVAAVALLLTGVCVLSWYVPLIWHHGWREYQSTVEQHRVWIMRTDSIFAHNHNGLFSYRWLRYFNEVWGAAWIKHIIYGFSLLGALALLRTRQWRVPGWLVVTFLPFMIFTFVIVTPTGAPLYAMPYLPLFTGLAACGLILPLRRICPAERWPRLSQAGFWLACGLTLAFAEWGYPVVKMLHGQTSPSMQAIQYLQHNLNAQKDVLLLDESFRPHVSLFLPEVKKVQREDDFPPEVNLINLWADRPRVIALTENLVTRSGLRHFEWTSKRSERRLKRMSLWRYFDAYVADTSQERGVVFVDGWWGSGSTPDSTWRWMAPMGKVALLGATEQMRLHFKGESAMPPTPTERPAITLRLNGAEIDRFTLNEKLFDRTLVVRADPARLWSTLEIEIDGAGVPGRLRPNSTDNREPGLICHVLEWTPVPGSPSVIKSPDQFLGEGWYELEHNEVKEWRKTEGVSVTHLPAIDGDAELDLRTAIFDKQLPEITVEIAGRVVEKIQPEADEITRSIRVPVSVHGGQPVDLKLSVHPIIPPRDTREFGLQVTYLVWRPQEKPMR